MSLEFPENICGNRIVLLGSLLDGFSRYFQVMNYKIFKFKGSGRRRIHDLGSAGRWGSRVLKCCENNCCEIIE